MQNATSHRLRAPSRGRHGLSARACLCATLCLLATLLAACGAPAQHQRATAWAIDPAQWALRTPSSGWLLLDPGEATPLDDAALKARLRGARVVFVGDQHDQEAHHLFQAHVLNLLAEVAAEEHSKSPDRAPVLLGLEMLRWPDQPLLDALAEGRGGEEALRTLWAESWGRDWPIYAPLLEAAQRLGAPIIALNAPRFLSRRVFEVGVDGLSDDERRYLPPTLDDSNPDYRAFVTAAMLAHAPPHGGSASPHNPHQAHAHSAEMDAAAQRFFLAQLVWDETMAHTLSQALHHTPTARALVAAGAAHVMYGWGIPSRLARDQPDASQILIICRSVTEDPAALAPQLDPAAADLFCLTRPPHPDARSAHAMSSPTR